MGGKATYDHFIPKCYGGIDDIANIVLSHRRCNILKGDRLPTPDEIDSFITLRRSARLPIWPPILALAEAEEGEEWIVVARAVAAEGGREKGLTDCCFRQLSTRMPKPQTNSRVRRYRPFLCTNVISRRCCIDK